MGTFLPFHSETAVETVILPVPKQKIP